MAYPKRILFVEVDEDEKSTRRPAPNKGTDGVAKVG